MTFDDVLDKVGSFGPFQRRVFAFICIPLVAQIPILLAQVFIAGNSDHWCRVRHWQDENCYQWNLTEKECALFKRNISSPTIEGDQSQCMKYNVSGMDLETAFNMRNVFNESNIINCDEGWEFDRSVFSSTILEEWELVCGNSVIPNVFQAIYFAGYLVGGTLFGSLADRIGRYYTFIFCCVTAGLSSILTALAPNVYIFIVLRFLTAATSYGATLMTFVIASEMVIPSVRVWTSVAVWFPASAGYFFLSGVASIGISWRLLVGIISVPYLVMIPIFPFLNESARWLIAKGRLDRAENVIHNIAKENHTQVPHNLAAVMQSENDEPSQTVTVLDFIGNHILRKYMLNMIFNWFVHGLVYFGLSLGTSSLGVNVYIAFCLSGLVEMPAHLLTILTMKKFGRRASTSFWMLLAGVSCLATTVVPLGLWRASVAMIGKLSVSVSFCIVYVYAGEILPTPLRALGVGICSNGARVGGMVAPLLLYLGALFESLPLVLFALLSIIGGILIILLPETNNKPLPDTIEEALNLKKMKDFSSHPGRVLKYEENIEPTKSELA